MNAVNFIEIFFQKNKPQIILLLFLVFVIASDDTFGQNSSLSFQEGKEMEVIGNEIHSYTLSLQKGDFLQLHLQQKGVNFQVITSIPEKDTLQGFLDNYRKDGLEIVEFPIEKTDVYTFKISPYISYWLKDSVRQNFIKNINGSYLVEKFKILSPKEHKELLKYRKKQEDSVISWIKDESITLKSVKAETGLKDLSYLKPILQDVRVVGLGETSHGTKEIFQMKHRMLEFLVKEMGFTLFGIEASHIGCRPINEYVLYGKGNSRDALSTQGFWIWNVESVIDMIEWMHRYNKTVAKDKKVQFIGIDTQMNGLDIAYKNVESYLKKTGDHLLLEVQVDSLFPFLKDSAHRSNKISEKRNELYMLLSYLVVNEFRLSNSTSKEEYLDVVSDLRKIIQGVESNDRELNRKFDFNIRDEYMGQTTLETLQKQGPEAKMVVWAHNGHINKDSDSYVNGYRKPLGSVLKRSLGEKYYAIGFATYQGTFQAANHNRKQKKYLGVNTFSITPAKEGSLDWYFAQSKKNICFIDFNKNEANKRIPTFLNKRLETNSVGSTWSYEYSYSPTNKIIPIKFYDGMIFIKETSGAILTPGGEKEVEKRLKSGKRL